MRRSIQVLAVTSALVAGLAAAPLLHAHESEDSGGSMMGPGMMGQGGMMGMMGQMSEMMETCNKMMRSMMQDGSDRPNEQRRNDAPEREEAPEENG